MTVVFADLGGTHLRFARAAGAGNQHKIRIADHASFEDALAAFEPAVDALYLATAVMPRGGMIEDTRFKNDCWRIDLAALERRFNLRRLVILNDLEAAGHAVPRLSGTDLEQIIPAGEGDHHFDHPPKLLVSVGTGIGHAFVFERAGCEPFVQRTHGGHFPALAATEEQRGIVAALDRGKRVARDLIAEDIVSGHGYKVLQDIARTDAPRLLWEFLGLYCNTLVSAAGAYGGVYLSGGLTDEFHRAGSIDRDAFAANFRRPMVPVVAEALAATPVYYTREKDLPLRGLAALYERHP